MTAIQLNAQIWHDMAEIADSEPLMRQLAKYLKKLVAKKEDPTLMTKEEFFRLNENPPTVESKYGQVSNQCTAFIWKSVLFDL